MSCKAVGITLQMVSSYQTVDDSPSPWERGRGEGERLFNSTVPAKCSAGSRISSSSRSHVESSPMLQGASGLVITHNFGGVFSQKLIQISIAHAPVPSPPTT